MMCDNSADYCRFYIPHCSKISVLNLTLNFFFKIDKVTLIAKVWVFYSIIKLRPFKTWTIDSDLLLMKVSKNTFVLNMFTDLFLNFWWFTNKSLQL